MQGRRSVLDRALTEEQKIAKKAQLEEFFSQHGIKSADQIRQDAEDEYGCLKCRPDFECNQAGNHFEVPPDCEGPYG